MSSWIWSIIICFWSFRYIYNYILIKSSWLCIYFSNLLLLLSFSALFETSQQFLLSWSVIICNQFLKFWVQLICSEKATKIWKKSLNFIWRYLKVSKSRKQNTKFSHTRKNQQNFTYFFALASKSCWIKKNKSSWIC